MALQKTYQRINWENYPSDKTPLNEQNLNKIDYSVNEQDDRIITLDVTKLDKVTANGLVKDIQLDRATGVFTITYFDNSIVTIDTLLEKLAVNFDYDYQTQELIISLDDGTEKRVDLSALITQFEFLNSDRIFFAVDGSGNVTADIKDNSIGEEKLRVDYLADIKKETDKVKKYSESAEKSEKNSALSELNVSNMYNNLKALAEQAIQNVVKTVFRVNFDTGNIEYTQGTHEFKINETTGEIEWRLSA